MAGGNVAVDLTVDEENRDSRCGHGIFRGNVFHVEVVLQAGAKECDFDERAWDGASHPRTQVEGLSHAVIGDLTKIGEGRLGGYGAEAWVGVERLEEFGGSHGFGEPEDATGMILRVHEVEPLVDVVALQKAVGGEWAATGAMGAGVGKQHGESVGKKELRVSGHADSVVAETVEEENGVAVRVVGTDDPCKQDGAVGRCDRGVGRFGIEGVGRLTKFGSFGFGERTARRVKSAVGQVDAADGAESHVQDESEQDSTASRGKWHGLVDGTRM